MMAIPFIILVVGLSLNFAVGFRRLGLVWDAAALAGAGSGSRLSVAD